VKSNTAVLELPELVIVAFPPGTFVDTVPTEIVAAAPVGPVGPAGIVKLNIAAVEVPELLTWASPPATFV
jgi:hypothetical protein